MRSSDDSSSSTGDWLHSEAENRHLYRLALSRMYRLMRGLLKKECPSVSGKCYWCGTPMYLEHIAGGPVYIGDLRGQHNKECPWAEVVDFKGYQVYLEGLDGAGAEATEGDD